MNGGRPGIAAGSDRRGAVLSVTDILRDEIDFTNRCISGSLTIRSMPAFDSMPVELRIRDRLFANTVITLTLITASRRGLETRFRLNLKGTPWESLTVGVPVSIAFPGSQVRSGYIRRAFGPEVPGAVEELLRKLDGGYSLGAKGKLRRPIEERGNWLQANLAHYDHVNSKFLTLFGKPLFLTGGNLLGAVREGAFIGHDDDFDLAYFSEFEKPAEVKREYLEIINGLAADGEQIDVFRKNGSIRGNYFWWRCKDTGRKIDIFPSFHDGKRFITPISVNIEIGRELIVPLSRIAMYERTFYVPRAPLSLMTRIYGPQWRFPDPLWSPRKLTTEEMNPLESLKVDADDLGPSIAFLMDSG